jgi:hypothetical protein
MPFSFARRKPAVVRVTHNRQIIHICGSLNLMSGATAEELAAITSIRQIFAAGSRGGHTIFGIFPLLVSFNATAIIVGTTTMNKRETAIPLMSIETVCPTKIDSVAGTIRGARNVSRRIKARPRALSPLKIATQKKPETAVGPANKSTKPEIISELEKTTEDNKSAADGITAWLVMKKSKIGIGFLTAVTSSAAVNFKAPEKVITAKRKITNGRRFINTPGKIKPRATAMGVVTGMKRFKKRLSSIRNDVCRGVASCTSSPKV